MSIINIVVVGSRLGQCRRQWANIVPELVSLSLQAVCRESQRQLGFDTGYSPKTVSILGQRRKRWANIETALGECHVFAGLGFDIKPTTDQQLHLLGHIISQY